MPLITRAIAEEPRWRETLRRLVTVDRVPADVARAIDERLNL